jgi:hypothetical protein
MDIGGIREAVRREPFRLFAIHLADGRAVRIRHPELIAVGTRRLVVVNEDDSTSFIEPLMITSLELESESA